MRKGIARGLDAVIVNPAHIIGRYDRKGWAQLIIAAHERWMPGVPPGAGTFCHAEAVAMAHIAAAERGRCGANYLMSGADASFVELFAAINEVTGARVPLRPLPAALFRLPARLSAAWASLSGKEPAMTPEGVEVAIARARVVSRRAEEELGYRPAPLATLVEDSWRWLLAEGLLRGQAETGAPADASRRGAPSPACYSSIQVVSSMNRPSGFWKKSCTLVREILVKGA